ncbi:helix-turn-helix domain-containing protein [Brucella sp. TWI559]
MPMITPNEAAKRTGRSRRTVMRAITRGELIARRANDGWQIEEKDLSAWAGAHGRADAPTYPDAHPAPTADEAVLKERIRALEELLSELRRSNDDLRVDRDRWHQLATRPWWKRLAG